MASAHDPPLLPTKHGINRDSGDTLVGNDIDWN